MEISVLIDKEYKHVLTITWLKKVVRQILVAENVNPIVEIDVVITGQDKIQELNRVYLDEDAPTDVLSFSMVESPADVDKFITPPDNTLRIGEVIISYPQAKKQAKQRGHRVKYEISLLVIHGILHLLGYDHDTPKHRRIMRSRESAILETIEEKSL